MTDEFLKLYEELSILNEDSYEQLSFDDIPENNDADTVLDIKTFDSIIKDRLFDIPKNIDNNWAKGIQVLFKDLPSVRACTMSGVITWQPRLPESLKPDKVDTAGSWLVYYFFTHYEHLTQKNATIVANMKSVAKALNITGNYYIIADPKNMNNQWKALEIYNDQYSVYSCLAGICIPYNQGDSPDKHIIERFATIIGSSSDQIEGDIASTKRLELAKEFLIDSPNTIWPNGKPKNFDNINTEEDLKKEFYFNVAPLTSYYQAKTTIPDTRYKIAALLDIFGFLVSGCPNSLQYLYNACKQEQLIAENLSDYVARNESATGAKTGDDSGSKNYGLLFAHGNKAITNASDFVLKINNNIGVEAKIYSTTSKINEVDQESLHNAKFAIVYCVKDGHWYLYEKDQKLNKWFVLTHETNLISRNFINAIFRLDSSCPGTAWRISTSQMEETSYRPETAPKTENESID